MSLSLIGLSSLVSGLVDLIQAWGRLYPAIAPQANAVSTIAQRATAEGRDLTPDEFAAVHAAIDAARAEVNAARERAIEAIDARPADQPKGGM